MKKHSHKLFITLLFSLILSGIILNANAQSKTIFYWNFDHFNSGLTVQGDPTLMKPIYSNWSSTDTLNGYMSDVTVPGTSKYYKAYWDNYPIAEAGDTFNVQHGGLNGMVTGNLAMRLRNPNDSMQLLITAPTTHYKNIAIKFDVFKSGSGPVKDLFDYSTDGGTTWVSTGLSMPSDSPSAVNWIPVTVKISNTAAENNSKFIFRIKTTPPNAILNGNDRFDNFSVAGDSIGGITPPPPTQKLIHYFHFNNLNTGLTAAGSPSLITPIHANWSTLDSTKALISYTPAYKVSSKYTTWWDAYPMTPADSNLNARRGATAGNALRVRNPSDSMQLEFAFPTTHYKNITLKYACEKSSLGSGQAKQVFDYSINGGINWRTAGLSIKSDSITNVIFNLITVGLAGDTAINNNPNFIFRIKFVGQNSGTSGNNRFDNITLEGDTDKAATANQFAGISVGEPVDAMNCSLYPNPAQSQVIVSTGSENSKTISIISVDGKLVYGTVDNHANIPLNISSLKSGVYIVNVQENQTGKTTYIRLIKY